MYIYRYLEEQQSHIDLNTGHKVASTGTMATMTPMNSAP
jgi:hypothetical protein